MKTGELTTSVACYRKVIGKKPFWLKHTYSSKRIAQLRARALRSIGQAPQSRYHKGWSRMYNKLPMLAGGM